MNNYEIINTMKLLFRRKLKEEATLSPSPVFFEKHKSWILSSVPILHPEIEEMDQVTVNTLYATARSEWLSTISVETNPGGTLVKPGYQSWMTPERKKSIAWNYTARYFGMLKKTGRSEKVIAQIDLASDAILEKLGDPRSQKDFFYKGLVVGNVQSGKTANFNAVINKSIDAGYSLIIVLSGIMEDLRSQTQQRIDNDVVGIGILDKASSRKGTKGVGLERVFGETGDNSIPQVMSITSYKSDFNRNVKNLDFSLNHKYILVCKKNTGVLKNLLIWLSEYLQENRDRHNIPLLIIDDEADNASLNNLGYRGRDYASAINGHIRALLGLFSRKSYLGYTATPFANVLQDRNPPSREKWPISYRYNGEQVKKEFDVVESIFPDDFVHLLVPPSNYIGAKQIFETVLDETIKLPLLVAVDDTEGEFPHEVGDRAPEKDDPFPRELPLSLREAVQCFVLTIAVRLSRKPDMINSRFYNPHHTMLVHVSRFISWQNRTKVLLADYLQTLENRIMIELPGSEGSVYRELEQIWNKYFAAIVTDIRQYLPEDYQDEFLVRKTYADIASLLIHAIKGIEIKAVNSVAQEKLEYNADVNGNGKKYIAIGGNCLSRGFTLEGLTINYFIRDTNYSDTLLQMGRWFGYRPGYIDCCKLFTTSEAISKFDAATTTIEELEAEFLKMDREGFSPYDFLIRVKKHPGVLKITRASILKNTTKINWSYQDKLEQTTKFVLNPGSIRSAWEDFTGFVKKYESRFVQQNDFYLLHTDH
ncbi:MAG TPA: Z1 domain-containing protein, partial [Puia sp.]|nr:Z1 domain-containing protein [Puia sp.]